MKLSIIVPVYNVEKFLPRCLDSLLCQGLNVEEYEIICVDDGSLDHSAQILADYEARNPDIIKTVTLENQGLGSARNTGIRVAKGEYITFVDSDDYVVSGGYSYLFQHFLTSKPDVLSFSCQVLREYDEDKVGEKIIKDKVVFEGGGRVAYNRLYIKSVWSKFYSRFFDEAWY